MQSIDHQDLARCLFDESNDALFIFRPEDNSLVDANPTALRLTGLSHAELMERRLPELFSAETAEDIDHLIDAFQKTGTFHSGEDYKLRRQQADPLPVQVTASRIHTKPQPLGLAVVRDISRQSNVAFAEHRLQKQFAELEQVYRTSPVGLCFVDTELRFVRINDELAEYNGTPVEEHIGRSLRNVLPDIADTIEPLYLRVIETNTPVLNIEVDKPDADESEIRHYLASYYPVADHDGKVIGVSAVVQDITTRKRSEEALRESEQRFRSLIENSFDVITMFDETGTPRYVSPSVERVLGYKPKELIGQQGLQIIHPDDAEEAGRFFARGLEQPGQPMNMTHRIRHKDGNYRTVEITGINLLDVPGVEAMVSNFRDVTEGLEAEYALRASEDRFRRLIEHAPEAVMLQDETGRFISVNAAAERLLGMPADQICKLSPSEMSPPMQPNGQSSAEKYLEVLNQIRAGETPVIEWTMFGAEGREIPCEVRLMGLEIDGRLVIRGSITDITERKRAETALRKSEERFRAVFNQQFQFMGIVSPEGRVLEVNELPLRVQGAKREDYVGHLFWQTPAWKDLPEWQAKIEQRIKQVAKIDEPSLGEDVYQTIDGELRYADSAFTAIRDAENNVQFILVEATDITDRKRAEQELRVRHRAIATSVMPAAFGDANHVITYANQAFADLMGFASPEQAVGMPNSRFESQPTSIAQINAAMEQHGSWTGEIVSRKLDGTPIDLYLSATLIRDEAGEPMCSMATFVDITERNRIREQREQLIAELEVKNAELERFTYTVSHDLKSPLVTITGFLGLLRKDLDEQNHEAIADDMAEIASGAGRMKELLEQLLDLSRVGHVTDPPEEVPLAELVNEVLGSISGMVAERNVKIALYDDLPTIRCDRVRMREVLQNLLENAIKFSGGKTEPHVEVGVRNGENEAIVFVKDNGIGIDPAFSEKVFGLFEQLDAGGEGTGIGLALSKRIIESHGGRIWVESDGVGHGSTICFTMKD